MDLVAVSFVPFIFNVTMLCLNAKIVGTNCLTHPITWKTRKDIAGIWRPTDMLAYTIISLDKFFRLTNTLSRDGQTITMLLLANAPIVARPTEHSDGVVYWRSAVPLPDVLHPKFTQIQSKRQLGGLTGFTCNQFKSLERGFIFEFSVRVWGWSLKLML